MYSLKISGTFDKKLCDCKLKESLQTVIELYENDILLNEHKYINNNELDIFPSVTFGETFKTNEGCFNKEYHIIDMPTTLTNKFKELNIYTNFEDICKDAIILRNTGEIDISWEFCDTMHIWCDMSHKNQ